MKIKLTTHTKNNKREHSHHKKGKHHHQNQKDNPGRSNRDLSNVRCYTCDEKGHFSRDCPKNKKKKNKKKRHHAHTAEDDEPPRKRTKGVSEDSSSNKEYVLIQLSQELFHMGVMIGLYIVGLASI